MDWATLLQIDWQSVIDYLAVGIGAVTGALYASARKLDIVGTITVGLITAYGGGIIRDMLLQDQGFFFMQHPASIVACALLGAIVFLFDRRVRKLERLLFYADALSMAWFALAGASKAWSAGTGVVLTVVLGAITAVGGGMLRDICTGRTPAIFQPGSFYAISGVAGAAAYVALMLLGAPPMASSIVCVVLAFGLTLLSSYFGWRTKPSG